MGSNIRPALARVEVPITGSDAVRWHDLFIPPNNELTLPPPLVASSHPFRDCSSCAVIGDPPRYLLWRIHKNLPQTLELLEFSSNEEFPAIGLRITFHDALLPFAYVCKNEVDFSPTKPYLLYAMTVSGVAYLFWLRNISAYSSCSVFPQDEIIDCNIREYFGNNLITSAVATIGFLAIGRNDGSVFCFSLGSVDRNAPGFVHELRDDSTIRRLLGFRNRTIAAVQDFAVVGIRGRKVLFVLHSDGVLRAWDHSDHSAYLCHRLSVPNSEGAIPSRLWMMSEVESESDTLLAAFLYQNASGSTLQMIHVFHLRVYPGEKIILAVEHVMKSILIDDGGCMEVKLTKDKVWILKENGVVVHDLFLANSLLDGGHCYALQEEFVAERLFQSSDLSADYLLRAVNSTFSSSKDHVVPFMFSIFLRRLLDPGVYHGNVMRSTLVDYNRHWSDSEFQSLSIDGLKKEICLLIEREGASASPASLFCNWKNFCRRYFHHWCKNNAPCGLLHHSSVGAVGLVRKSSVSLFRDLENIELFLDGGSVELVDVTNVGLDLSDEDSGREIFIEVRRCIINMSQQLGKTASAIYYESFVGSPAISSEEIVPCLLRILETGHMSSTSSFHLSDMGSDFAVEKELCNHKSLRKFSVDMLLSLHTLLRKATSWSKVLDAIESYLQFLVSRKIIQKSDVQIVFNINSSILFQATSQIAKVMFESALDILLFVSYLCSIGRQINMMHNDISRIQLEFIPMLQDTVFEWLIIYYLGTSPSQSPGLEDFSSQLSSLQIGTSSNKRSWSDKLGKCDFTLAFIVSLTIQESVGDCSCIHSLNLPSPEDIVIFVRDYTSWLVWGKVGDEFASLLRRSIDYALVLLRHGQYSGVEYLLRIVEAYCQREKTFKNIQVSDGDWCGVQHLLGCCLLGQARHELHGVLKEKKVGEAICCFFRASSGQHSSKVLQSLCHDGLPHLDLGGFISTGAWKLHYYQWVMQIFEQYDISEGACQFALAALEQVDEALNLNDPVGQNTLNESATTIKGRLWANVFKFMLDLNHLHEAYCAILSNPDDDSKNICLRRFIFVLYERGVMKVLCDGQLPFIGLTEKIERELVWKAERSDVLAKPNPYKFLYAFEMQRHNWQRAASYMYQYSTRLRTEVAFKDQQHRSVVLLGRLNGLSAAINALHLVHPANAWIDFLPAGNSLANEYNSSKKSKRIRNDELSHHDFQPLSLPHYVDIEKLEDEFVLASAEYLLSLANVRWTYNSDGVPSDLVDHLVEANLCDMAFTIILKFWKGSAMVRELERIFSALSLRCCSNKVGSSAGKHTLLLTSSMEEIVHSSPDVGPALQQPKGNTQWETLQLYLDKYKGFHAGLPLIVAESLLLADSQIELPLWLVHMFKKDSCRDRTLGMTGKESNPASLFQLYVNHGRYAEATNLLLEYTESFAAVRPSELLNRKRPFSVWFPYTVIEHLWCQLEELINSGQMVDQCDKLKRLIYAALQKHLKLLKVDSEDAISSAC